MAVDEGHFINRVLHDPGTYELTADQLGSPYVVLAGTHAGRPARPRRPGGRDRSAGPARPGGPSHRPFVPPEYDAASLKRTREALLSLASDLTSFESSFGRREDVDPVHHLDRRGGGMGRTARRGGHLRRGLAGPAGRRVRAQRRPDVPVDGFWSISVYNAEGYFEPNEREASTASTTSPPSTNDDGSVDGPLRGRRRPRARTRCRSPRAGTTWCGSTGPAPRSSPEPGASRRCPGSDGTSAESSAVPADSARKFCRRLGGVGASAGPVVAGQVGEGGDVEVEAMPESGARPKCSTACRTHSAASMLSGPETHMA